jgi:hypothetical protein
MKNNLDFEAISTTALSDISGGMRLNAAFLRQIARSEARFNADKELQNLVKRERRRAGLR